MRYGSTSRRGRWLLVLGVVVLLATGASCGPKPNPGDDAGDGGDWTLDGGDSTDGGEAGADGGGDGDLSMTLGRLNTEERSFEKYPVGEARVEVVSGFQGGFHVEPSILLQGVEADPFEAELEYEVRDRDSGEVMTRPTLYNIESRWGWLEYKKGDGVVHHSNPVIFDGIAGPEDVEGEKVILWVRAKIMETGAEVEVEKEAEIINETNELGE